MKGNVFLWKTEAFFKNFQESVASMKATHTKYDLSTEFINGSLFTS